MSRIDQEEELPLFDFLDNVIYKYNRSRQELRTVSPREATESRRTNSRQRETDVIPKKDNSETLLRKKKKRYDTLEDQ